MTTEPESPQPTRFVTVTLPWVAAAAGLILYLVTLGRWITANSLPTFAQVSGFQWQPVLSDPVYFLLTLPLKLLPIAWLSAALNVFSAVCASLVLALLARSVALLPHNRTHPQRLAERSEDSLLTIRAAWFPLVFATLVCGLQFAFWERATASGPEMLDLLLLAYAVRCLLEYRRDGRESWLFQAVFTYALGMTDNWLMVLLLPAFVVSLVWLMGFSFFNLRFLSRAWLLGLAGLGFYLLLPLVAVFHSEYPLGYWPALKYLLADQKNTIVGAWQAAKDRLVLSTLCSVLPLLIIGLRFRTNSGDTSRMGTGLATFCFHALHGAFLVLCGWLALDPAFTFKGSAVQLGSEFLAAKYLSALALGYFAGYFLLLFGERAKVSRRRHGAQFQFNRAILATVWVFSIVVVAALVCRNLPLIRQNNGQVLREYASLLTQTLPAKPAILLSDDPRRLWLARAVLARQSGGPKHLPVDTRLLVSPNYHRTLNRMSGGAWPLPPANQPINIDSLTIADRVLQQVANQEVYYLHPSFGYYFEFLHAIPHGMTHALRRHSTNSLFAPPLSPALLEENLKFWNDTAAPMLARAEYLLPRTEGKQTTNWLAKLLYRARVVPGPNADARAIASLLSRDLNHWGVQLQRANRLAEAGEAFARAEALNPDNVAAQVNREFNRNLADGSKATVTLTPNIEDRFGAYRTWDQVVGENGPFDEPTFCYEQGRVFAQASLYRQALQEFERVRALAPDDIPSRLWLANVYYTCGLHREVLGVLDEIKSAPDRFALTHTNRTDILSIEAAARFAKGEGDLANQLLQTAIAREPTNYYLLAISAQVYMRNGLLTNALKLFDQQLRLQPGDTDAMMNKGYVCVQGGVYREAILTLDRLLQIQTSNYPALINRAIANLQAGELDAAQRDYETLAKVYPDAYQVHYGLGELAWRKKDTNAAISAYERYLAKAPMRTAEATNVVKRLQQLKAASP